MKPRIHCAPTHWKSGFIASGTGLAFMINLAQAALRQGYRILRIGHFLHTIFEAKRTTLRACVQWLARATRRRKAAAGRDSADRILADRISRPDLNRLDQPTGIQLTGSAAGSQLTRPAADRIS
jgi:hypothetical protein